MGALIHHYARHRARRDDDVVVGIFGGAPPNDALLDALDGRPFTARVRPDLLTRADVDRMVARNCIGVELDVLSFADRALAAARRRYRAPLVERILAGLSDAGIEIGVVLAPGLPGSSFDTSVADAHRVAGRVHTARIHPVLVLEHSALEQLHMDQRYVPLQLGETVTVCRAMVDVLEDAGTKVVRVGLQPGPDGFGRAVAGPRHPAIRHLVEARRALDQLRVLVGEAVDGPGAVVEIRCSPADESIARGPFNQHVRTLRADYGLSDLVVRADVEIRRGDFAVAVRDRS